MAPPEVDLAAQNNDDFEDVPAESVHTSEVLEAFAGEIEQRQAGTLQPLFDQAEKDFAEGRGIPWERVKAAHSL